MYVAMYVYSCDNNAFKFIYNLSINFSCYFSIFHTKIDLCGKIKIFSIFHISLLSYSYLKLFYIDCQLVLGLYYYPRTVVRLDVSNVSISILDFWMKSDNLFINDMIFHYNNLNCIYLVNCFFGSWILNCCFPLYAIRSHLYMN